MNRNESKYFSTAIKMDEALLSLLEKKDFAYITVKEICETAGVNRSTFYLHYQNTSELLREATDYILDKHFAYYGIKSSDIVGKIDAEASDRDLSSLIFVTREYLAPYLLFIKENRRVFKLAIKQFQVMNMDEVYGRMFKHVFEPILASFQVPEKERQFVMKFYLTGVFAVVMEWLDGDCSEDIDFIIKIVNDCTLGARERYG